MNDSLTDGFRIGEHAIQPRLGRIVSRSGEVHVEPRAMDVLVALARRAGDTVSRDDLIEAVWKHPHVSDEALSRCISLLRHALGDDRAQPRYLETIPKRGYRLVAPVEVVGAAPLNDARRTLPDTENDRLVPPDRSRTNLALQPTRLIGREAELAEVIALLASQRLVTLTGSGGVGKSRLAFEAGSRSIADFADGVWLAELAPLSDPDLIPGTVAAALGIELGHGTHPLKALTQRIAGRNLLLILDNCERLIDAVAVLCDALLGSAPGVRVLATSQVLINVAGEQVYPVPSLSVPDDDGRSVDQVVGSVAVQLFVERARSADLRFQLLDDIAATVGAICRRLDGIPLAIEMAAARAATLGVEQVARLLDERFRVLTSGRRTALPRHQTLRATLDWSYQLLTEHEQIVLRRLAVFVGGFTLDAASTVATDDSIDKLEVLDLVSHLIARSLVDVYAHAAGRRYRLLETTRLYAQDRLAASGEGDATRTRHLGFFLALAEEAEPRLVGREEHQWNAWIDAERENFRAAFGWCATVEPGADAALRLAYALRTWLCRGALDLGEPPLAVALDRPGVQGPTLVRCRGLLAAGFLCYFWGRHDDASRYLAESLAIARNIGAASEEVDALSHFGLASVGLGDRATARVNLSRGLALARLTGDKHLLTDALINFGELHSIECDLESAASLYEEALSVAQSFESRHLSTVVILNLARISIDRGAVEHAEEMLRTALKLLDEIGSTRHAHALLALSAALAALLGDWERAARFHGASNRQLELMGMQREPTDEATIAPLMAQARGALDPSVFGASESAGRARSCEVMLAEVRTWLQERTLDAHDRVANPS